MGRNGDWKSRVILFLLVWFSVVWFGSWEWNPNNLVRLATATSLVEKGDATIDEFAPLTIDKARFDGHIYLDKAPGMTLAALPAVWLATYATARTSAGERLAWGDPGLARFLRLRQRIAVASGPALLLAIAAILLLDIGLTTTGRADAALVGALGTTLGTPLWGWSTTLAGHATVAAMYVIALWAFVGPPRSWRGLVGGGALGWAVVVEYQAALAGTAIAVWAAWQWHRSPRGRCALGVAAAAGLTALVPLLLYNMVAFGTPWRIGYAGVVGFEGMDRGLFGLAWPRPMILLEILIGDRRGLFWVAPVLLVAPIGLLALGDGARTRSLAIVTTVAAAIVLLVNAAYFYWDGGNSTGPRHALPAAALLGLGLAPWWAGLTATWQRWLAAGLLALSIAINAAIAAADIFSPPEFRYPLWRNVVEHRLLQGDLRTFPSEWLGWTPWQGLALYAALALPLLLLLARRVRSGSS